MAEYPREKQPPGIPWDYEGLQVDTRAEDGRDKHLDPTKPLPNLRKWQEEEDHTRYLNEKQMIQAHDIPQSTPTSAITESSMDSFSPHMSKPKSIDDSVGIPPEPRAKRICGLRRGIFWLFFGIVLAMIIIAAVVGGVVGATRQTSRISDTPSPNSPTSTPPSTPPATGNVPAGPNDVVAGSPLNVISYDSGGNGSLESRQTFRLYYQSVIGHIKESVSTGLGPWASATPIFTDAANNTGLATITYMNSTEQWGQMFYIGTNGFLQEKRKPLNDKNTFWEPGSLNDQVITPVGNISLPNNEDKDPINSFDSYRMAAAYSENYSTGPGTRLFYHTTSANGTAWVQEWIWTRATDNWTKGQNILNVYPNSHLAATVDEQNMLLRLYFSSGNLTIQEVWLNISNPDAIYNNGIAFPKWLPQNDVDLAATSYNGTTYLYHPSNKGIIGIKELVITGIPSSTIQGLQETFNATDPVVARPQLTSVQGTSPYLPLTASRTMVNGTDGFSTQNFVFWADGVSGNDDPAKEGSENGYTRLQALSRDLTNSTWPTSGQATIPLGGSNDSKRKRWLSWISWLL